MAHPSVNCACLVAFIVAILFTINVCQASGDFTDDDDYYDLSLEDSAKTLDGNNRDLSMNGKVNKLSVDRKLQDYLLGIQSHVFANNDVLTVKERKPSTSITKQRYDKFTVELAKASARPDDIQSDQPHNSGKWKPETPPLEATPSQKQQNAPTSKPNESSATKDANVVDSASGRVETNVYIQPWNCQFQANQDCGIVNDLSVGNYFHLKSQDFFRNFERKLGWYLLLNASAVPEDALGARLITPYMKTSNVSQGCLSLHYITTGTGVARVSLYQQDRGNYCLWSKESQSNFPIEMPVNHKMDFTVDLFRGPPRYFIEIYLDLTKPFARQSMFALASLRLAYQPCLVNNANQCRPPQTPNEHKIVMP